MKKKNRVLSIVSFYIVVAIIYLILILFGVRNFPLYLILTIGSVAVLSTGTIYTIVHSDPIPMKKKSLKSIKNVPLKKKTRIPVDLIEDYFDAMPLIDKYVASPESYEEIESIDDYIFSVISPEDLAKIDLLDLSKMDKIFFIRELLYYEPDERKTLIGDMLKNRDITDDQILYHPPLSTINIDDKLRVYIRSLIEPGEKTKILIIDTAEIIEIIKEKIGILFDYSLEDFLLSSGGILLQEDLKIRDYSIEDDDEIALIPSKKGNN